MAAFREGRQGSGAGPSPGPSSPAVTMTVSLTLAAAAIYGRSHPAITSCILLHPGLGGLGASNLPAELLPKDSTLAHLQDRARAWAATGIISLRDQQLQIVPEQLWQAQIVAKARAADLGGNCLETLPPRIGQLASLQRLRLSHNWLTVEGMPWDALAGLTQLATLVLDSNR